MRRRSVFALLLVLCLMMATAVPVTAFAESTAYVHNPSGRKVNVRQGPAKAWPADGQLAPGTKVTVLGTEDEWTEIGSPLHGFIMSQYLTTTPPEYVVDPEKENTRYIISSNGKKVNARTGPGITGYAVATQLEHGTKVKLVSSKDGWSEIVVNGFTVYVQSQYLTSENPAGVSGTAAVAKIRYITSSNGKKVNARTGPGTKGYAVATQLEPGTKVILLSSKDGWSAIEVNGFTVYVMNKYLSYAPSGFTSKPTTTSTIEAITPFDGTIVSPDGKKVNMRVLPDLSADRVVQIEPGAIVHVSGSSGSWYKVSYLGATGYVLKKYIK